MKLVRLTNYSGEGCSIYSILEDGVPRFQKFLQEITGCGFEKELININGRLISIGKYGATEGFFKPEEWKDDEKICCLSDIPSSKLRIFCIRFESERIIVLGGGGAKPKDIRAWQEDPKLSREAKFIIMISGILRKKIDQGDITEHGTRLNGNLNIP
ncbi:MAG: hypothetical protein LH478_04050 [Chitinophagaceae bacterium]|nr:hypothetical protein [Chitinophagaceae bacterium]